MVKGRLGTGSASSVNPEWKSQAEIDKAEADRKAHADAEREKYQERRAAVLARDDDDE